MQIAKNVIQNVWLYSVWVGIINMTHDYHKKYTYNQFYNRYIIIDSYMFINICGNSNQKHSLIYTTEYTNSVKKNNVFYNPCILCYLWDYRLTKMKKWY